MLPSSCLRVLGPSLSNAGSSASCQRGMRLVTVVVLFFSNNVPPSHGSCPSFGVLLLDCSVLQDKNFKKEMDKLMASDEWKNGADDATKFLQDPKAMEALAKQVCVYNNFMFGCFSKKQCVSSASPRLGLLHFEPFRYLLYLCETHVTCRRDGTFSL